MKDYTVKNFEIYTSKKERYTSKKGKMYTSEK